MLLRFMVAATGKPVLFRFLITSRVVANLLLSDMFRDLLIYYICPVCSVDPDLARIMIHIDVCSARWL